MKDFRRQFLLDSVKNLKNLQKNLTSAEKFSDSERREVFRTLHTIKGSAQTFGFIAAGKIAHKLENLLSAEKVTDKNFRTIFSEGIGLLANALEQNDFELPAQFAEKIHRIIPANLQFYTIFNISSTHIPLEIAECLSQTEKIAIDSALNSGKNIYCFEVGFDTTNFADDLINCREKLTEICEIIATFPGEKLNLSSKIGFRLICASSAKKARLEDIAEICGAKITFDISPESFTEDLRGVVSKAVAHGRDLAEKLGKNIDFQISAEEINFPVEKPTLVFDILIHLIRNAVDHGVKIGGGRIEIGLKSENNGLLICVGDDGNGINLEKLKAKAIEKKIISAEEILTEQATLDLVFQSELSTAQKITEISGRGIGLDVVKTLVEKSGGTIRVESRKEKGTIFEVFLPS